MGEAAYQAKWSFEDGATPTFDVNSDAWDLKSDTVKKDEKLLTTSGIRGTRGRVVANSRRGPYDVGGDISIEPSPAFLSRFLQRAMGGGTTTAPALADALIEFGMMAERAGDCVKYVGCKINSLKLSGSAGGLIDCTINLFGKTETGGQTFAGSALGTDGSYEPFQHADLVLTLEGAARTCLSWDLTIQNNVRARGANSYTADFLIPGPRKIMFNCTVPYDSTVDADLYTDITKNGSAGTLLLQNDNQSALNDVSCTFSFAAVQVARQSPQIAGDEFTLAVRAEIAGTTGAEMTCSLDLTP